MEFLGKILTDAVHLTPDYGRWIWEKVLHDNLVEDIRATASEIPDQVITGFLNINCILFDGRLMSHVLPFKDWDEREINTFLKESDHYGIMTAKSVVHHYSFGPQQALIDEQVHLSKVFAHLFPNALTAKEKKQIRIPRNGRPATPVAVRSVPEGEIRECANS